MDIFDISSDCVNFSRSIWGGLIPTIEILWNKPLFRGCIITSAAWETLGSLGAVFIYIGLVLVAKSCPTLRIPWTIAHQAPLSMGFSRQEYWSGLPFPSPEDLPNPGTEPGSPALQADSLPTLFLYIALPTELWGKSKNTGMPFPSPGDLPDTGIEARSAAL